MWIIPTTSVGLSDKKVVFTQISDLLRAYCFKEADSMIEKHWDLFDISKYESFKAEYLGKYFNDRFNLKFEYDSEQLEAISSIHKNTLVTARAWSGKTQVIAWKTAYLLDNEKLPSSEILLLSFNKKAAGEMNERIQKLSKKSFENAMTFHSLAYKILWDDNKGKKILMNSEKYTDTKTGVEKEYKTNKQLQFIQNCFYDIYDGHVKKTMERYLKNELNYFKHSSYLDNDELYYNYRKKREYFAFSWDMVRSKWEKYIIDFLYEHGFSIEYEPYIKIEKYWSKPDVKCNIYKDGTKLLSKDIIIEHWGFDAEDCFKKLPIWQSISWKKYAEIREQKIKYWKQEEAKWNCYFVQTHAKDIFHNRVEFLRSFKKEISKILENEWVDFKSLDKNILIERLRKNEKTIFPLTKKLEHFINKSQQKHLSPTDIEKLIISIEDEQERAFITIANETYKKYEIEKKKQNYLDFNEILKTSAKKLDRLNCDIDMKLWNNKINLKYIKYLIIDEYQDFSTLFYMLLETILKHNPECKLFFVWDSWQSINSFAGSEIWYFFDFRKLFSSTTEKKISTNYRSYQTIVEMWNTLMESEWTGRAQWLSPYHDWWEKESFIDISKISICDNERINHIFSKWEDGKTLEQAKNIFEQVISIVNQNKWKNIMFISRNNRVFWYELVDWRMKLYYYYFDLLIRHSDIDIQKNASNIDKKLHRSDKENYKKLNELFDNNLEFITAHKSKGKEAEVVVLLDIDEKKYPSNEKSLKEDIKYDRIFKVDAKSLLNDERRLFYVAITRAKEKLYIISESKKVTWLYKKS